MADLLGTVLGLIKTVPLGYLQHSIHSVMRLVPTIHMHAKINIPDPLLVHL